jgi:hypothetical protein
MYHPKSGGLPEHHLTLPKSSYETPLLSWLSAVRALGALSFLDLKDVGLANFGSHKLYFPRQMKSLSKVSRAQAAMRDVDTGEPIGDIPSWSELIAWYERHLPDECKTGGARIVHGDYKLNNVVFHPTENRMTGILDWELCTLGSPVRKANQLFVLCVVVDVKKPPLHSLVGCVGVDGTGDNLFACFVAGRPGKLDTTMGPRCCRRQWVHAWLQE